MAAVRVVIHMVRANRPTLLTDDQLAFFRTQVAKRRDAAFIAPQLLEQVALLSSDVRAAMASLDGIRQAIGELEAAMSPSTSGEPRITDSDRFVKALARLRALVG